MPKRIAHKPNRRPTFLKEWRQYRNLTQEQLADRLATTKVSISRIERGEQPYTQDFLEAVAYALRCEPADLLVRNPLDPEAVWSVWERLEPAQRTQGIRLLKALKGEEAA